MLDAQFHEELDFLLRLTRGTAKNLESQVGRLQSEFNQECLQQELLWKTCLALRKRKPKNVRGFATRVVRNGARDILRRARRRAWQHRIVSLEECGEASIRPARNQSVKSAREQAQYWMTVIRYISVRERQLIQTLSKTSESEAAVQLGVTRHWVRKTRDRIQSRLRRLRETEIL